MVKPSLQIDACAKTIFQNIEYRPGTKSWKYMRKLNCFVDSKRAFLFLDVNSLPLCGFSYFQSILLQSQYDILFGSYSCAGRTLRKKYKFIFNQVLDDQIHNGYSCSLILGREGVMQDRDFELLSSPNLLNFIKKAPEQGYISVLLSLSSLRHGPITRFLAEHRLVEGKKVLRSGEFDINYKEKRVQDIDGNIIYRVKTTGPSLEAIPEAVLDFVHDLQPK